MRLIRLTDEYCGEIIQGTIGRRGPKLGSCALALGSFDGLHLGHQKLIAGVGEAKRRLGLEAAAIWTFKQHPRSVLDPGGAPFLLTTWREKLAVLQGLGCEVIVAADFSPGLARLDYRDFVRRFMVDYLGMKHLVAGYDVHIGRGREGTAATLHALGPELGYTMEVAEAVRDGGRTISSSAIRAALAVGDVAAAERMLGRPYALWGEVVPGDGRGRTIGYPTANIEPFDELKLLPATGVYAVKVWVPSDALGPGCGGVLAEVTDSLPEVDRDGDLLSTVPGSWSVFAGMLNYGSVPTFNPAGLAVPRLEAHLLGFKGMLRGRNLKVEWVSRLRPERKFAGAEDLIRQLDLDARDALAAVQGRGRG